MKHSNSNKEKKSIEFRTYRPHIVHGVKQNKTLVLNIFESFDVNNTKIEFLTPNIVSMFVNISNESYNKAVLIYKKTIRPKLIKEEKVEFRDQELSHLYDYLEAVKVSIIFAYNSIEAFVNIAIPSDYTYENINNRGIIEIWNKDAIHRWMSTSDKLSKIIPELRELDNPKDKKFWSNFKELEDLRNKIIHPKPASTELNVSNQIHKSFFDISVFNLIRSTGDVLNFCCQGEYSEMYFPVGFGPKKTKVAELDDLDKYWEEVK